ncbi:MAG TPA: hypothetical protein VHN99_04320 [Deinococcales bacterium]|nr:hypothetical protein [Deinococcales bacterium]
MGALACGGAQASPFTLGAAGGLGVAFGGPLDWTAAASLGLRDPAWPVGARLAARRGPLGLSLDVAGLYWLDERSGSTYLGGGLGLQPAGGAILGELVFGFAWTLTPALAWTLEANADVPLDGAPAAFSVLTGAAYRIP